MKNKAIVTSFIGTMLLLGIVSGIAYAKKNNMPLCDDRQGRMEMKHEKRLAVMADVLDLSDTQQQQIQAIVEQEQTDMEENREKMHQGREQMRSLLDSDSFDESAIRSLAISQESMKTEMFIAQAKVKHQIFQLLNSEQRDLAEKLKPLLHKPGGKHHKRMPEI